MGPEITNSVLEVFEAAGSPVEWEVQHEFVTTAPGSDDPVICEAAMDSLRRNRVGLKGPFGTPSGQGHVKLHQELRLRLKLFANVRLAKSVEGCPTAYDGVNLAIIRENTEGEYSGLEHEIVSGVVTNLKVITRAASERIARFAFEFAASNGRGLVTCAHKANVMKLSDGLFLRCCEEVAKDYPSIKFEAMDMDRVVLQLSSRPERFDVLVLPNLYGDVASDMAAGLIGGLSLTPSANIGSEVAVFESVHGTAPDIAGKNLANPVALLMSAALMLRHLRLDDVAACIETATLGALRDGCKTMDLGGTALCTEVTQEICDRIVASRNDGGA